MEVYDLITFLSYSAKWAPFMWDMHPIEIVLVKKICKYFV